VVWPALRCAELDCFTGYRPNIGRVVSAEHPNQEKHEHPPNEHAHKNILDTSARQPNSGDGLSYDLDASRTRTSICRAGMGNLCGLHPLAPEFAVVWLPLAHTYLAALEANAERLSLPVCFL
jgi:hypothetical protein